MTAALAIFVKTPGLSPIKTRLAQALGQRQAEHFYRLAAAAVAAAARQLAPAVKTFWAVAEPARSARPYWSELPLLSQGEGELGVRMHRVYTELSTRFDHVLLTGADVPQVTPAQLHAGLAALETTPFSVGPAADGGFWLFAGSRPVPPVVWNSVVYSQADTRRQFCIALKPLGAVAQVAELRDVDTAADLPPLVDTLAGLIEPTPEQNALLHWLRARLRFGNGYRCIAGMARRGGSIDCSQPR